MRIISGEFGSRPLKAVPGKGTRPTTDKIKESMFNLIGQGQLTGTCLDFYGGSGALAIEAVSRGCDFAVITERNPAAVATIRQNVAMTGAEERFIILPGPNRKSLKKYKDQTEGLAFDWVFIDPPYKAEQVLADITWLHEEGLLEEDVTVVCEVGAETVLPEAHAPYEKIKDRTYGQSRLCFYRRGVQHDG